MTEILRCEGLVVGHEGKALLPAMDVAIARGSFVALIGRNGSGKSTWMRTILGFERPLAGRIVYADGVRLAYMPQAMNLDAMLPVRALDLVEWGRLEGAGLLRPGGSADDRLASHNALAAVKAESLADTLFRDLSEGQKQRVLLARLIARRADLAFLDEPTAAMDAIAEREAMDTLKRLTREHGMTVVVVTHLMALVARFADQALYFGRNDGAVVSGPAAEVFAHPAFKHEYGDKDRKHV